MLPRARGHKVEIWEKADKAGGQVPLAIASPDKAEVEAVWTYRMDELKRFGVPIRTGMTATGQNISDFHPDLVVLATGAQPRTLKGLAGDKRVRQSWDVLLDPGSVPENSRVVVIGGGMVGVECADLLAMARGCKVTVIEATGSIATDMARNNRLDVILPGEEGGSRTSHRQSGAQARGQGNHHRKQGCDEDHSGKGDVIVLAVGPVPDRSLVPEIERTGLPYVLVGDCNEPGDFMTCIRDASMVAIAIDDLRLPRKEGAGEMIGALR